MKSIYLLAVIVLLGMTGCVNQQISARRSDIPWNQPKRSEATGALPSSVMDQYE